MVLRVRHEEKHAVVCTVAASDLCDLGEAQLYGAPRVARCPPYDPDDHVGHCLRVVIRAQSQDVESGFLANGERLGWRRLYADRVFLSESSGQAAAIQGRAPTIRWRRVGGVCPNSGHPALRIRFPIRRHHHRCEIVERHSVRFASLSDQGNRLLVFCPEWSKQCLQAVGVYEAGAARIEETERGAQRVASAIYLRRVYDRRRQELDVIQAASAKGFHALEDQVEVVGNLDVVFLETLPHGRLLHLPTVAHQVPEQPVDGSDRRAGRRQQMRDDQQRQSFQTHRTVEVAKAIQTPLQGELAARWSVHHVIPRDEVVLQRLVCRQATVRRGLKHQPQQFPRLVRGPQLAQLRWDVVRVSRIVEARPSDARGRIGEERATSDHLVEDKRRSPDVTFLHEAAACSLRRLVGHSLRATLTEPEVHHLQGGIRRKRCELEVLCAHVVVRDTLAMAAEESLEDVAKAFCGEALAETTNRLYLGGQARALEQLHHQQHLSVLDEVLDESHDVRVLQRG
mmetsp:Transcript_80627/g.224372  ORF Transcript_80627/g.224372 Transcript_80627/m.224372 type:complete len:511 (+) Transcript_80627:755-2287(+)